MIRYTLALRNLMRKNIIGQTFGRLTVVGDGSRRGHRILWRCVCVCGKEREVEGYSLYMGRTKSCGCFKTEAAKNRCGAKSHAFKHGGTISKYSYIYRTWTAHLRNILSEKAKYHKYYKNMPIFPEWDRTFLKNSAYLHFEKYILETLGPRPGKEWSLDIIDHTKGFVPGNLRWAQFQEQVINRRYIFNSSPSVLLSRVSLEDIEKELNNRIPEYGIGVMC